MVYCVLVMCFCGVNERNSTTQERYQLSGFPYSGGDPTHEAPPCGPTNITLICAVSEGIHSVTLFSILTRILCAYYLLRVDSVGSRDCCSHLGRLGVGLGVGFGVWLVVGLGGGLGVGLGWGLIVGLGVGL